MAPLTADAKRLRIVIISFPVFVVTSAILYRRTYMGEEQRRLPSRTEVKNMEGHDSILNQGRAVGGAPWIKQGQDAQREQR